MLPSRRQRQPTLCGNEMTRNLRLLLTCWRLWTALGALLQRSHPVQCFRQPPPKLPLPEQSPPKMPPPQVSPPEVSLPSLSPSTLLPPPPPPP